MDISKRSRGLAVSLVVLSLTSLAYTPIVSGATFQLPADTELKVQFNRDAKINSGDIEADTKLAITLVEPIRIGDVLLVAEGASGSAVVKEVEKAGAPGKCGKIVVEFTELGTRGGFKTVDGSAIKLTGTVEDEGGISLPKKILAYITIALIKGGQGKIDTEETYTAKVAETVVLQSD
jgi:hypothetical protein